MNWAWPTPYRKGSTPSLVNGVPTLPYDHPILRHVCRIVDSSQTRDWATQPRTFRAKRMELHGGRLVGMLGESMVGYDLSRILAPDYFQIQRKTGPGEIFLRGNVSFDPWPEWPGWLFPSLDGQTFLYDFAVDQSRDLIYCAWHSWGWSINRLSTLGLIRHVNFEQSAGGQAIGWIRSPDGKTSVQVGSEVWDVTNPVNPTRTGSSNASDPDQVIGLAGHFHTASGNEIRLASDGSRIITVNSRADRSHCDIDGQAIGALRADGCLYSQGHLTIWGQRLDRREAGLLFWWDGAQWIQRSLSNINTNWIGDYYRNPNRDYAVLGNSRSYVTIIHGMTYFRHADREFLLVSAHGLGDVYEIAPLGSEPVEPEPPPEPPEPPTPPEPPQPPEPPEPPMPSECEEKLAACRQRSISLSSRVASLTDQVNALDADGQAKRKAIADLNERIDELTREIESRPAPQKPDPIADEYTAILLDRFRARVRYRRAFDDEEVDTDALVKPVHDFADANFQTALFHYGSSNNVEIMVKMLNQGNTDPDGHPTFAVITASATPLRTEVLIEDTQSNESRRYISRYGTQAGYTDFGAFRK